MDTQGYGGRGAIHYTCDPVAILNGVLLTDPVKEPADGWNKPRVVDTPFGKRTFSGAMILKCGECGKDIWPKPANTKWACACE